MLALSRVVSLDFMPSGPMDQTSLALWSLLPVPSVPNVVTHGSGAFPYSSHNGGPERDGSSMTGISVSTIRLRIHACTGNVKLTILSFLQGWLNSDNEHTTHQQIEFSILRLGQGSHPSAHLSKRQRFAAPEFWLFKIMMSFVSSIGPDSALS